MTFNSQFDAFFKDFFVNYIINKAEFSLFSGSQAYNQSLCCSLVPQSVGLNPFYPITLVQAALFTRDEHWQQERVQDL